jgi:hypothetical protein
MSRRMENARGCHEASRRRLIATKARSNKAISVGKLDHRVEPVAPRQQACTVAEEKPHGPDWPRQSANRAQARGLSCRRWRSRPRRRARSHPAGITQSSIHPPASQKFHAWLRLVRRGTMMKSPGPTGPGRAVMFGYTTRSACHALPADIPFVAVDSIRGASLKKAAEAALFFSPFSARRFGHDQRCTLRFSADVLPLFETSSYSTACPSLRLLRPARSTAEMCTNTSLPPLCG